MDIMQWLTESELGRLSFTALVSMLPVVELRGAIPFGHNVLELGIWPTFLAAAFGNMLPIPFILLFIRKIFAWMKQIGWLKKWIEKLENKTRKKGARIQKGWLIGLIIFVGIPLPGTGGWTGALAADLFDIRFKHALPAITIGVALAGAIMLILTYFFPGLFGFVFQ